MQKISSHSKNGSNRFSKTLFIFRRDLRLEDNTGLIFALSHSDVVIAAFIFTPEQIEHNPYRSDHCLKFMLESLIDLQQQLKNKGGTLYLFKGKVEAVLKQCVQEEQIDAVVINKDYTPYSRKRDLQIETFCKRQDIAFYSFDDALLHPPEETLKKDKTPYTIFTPYFRNASKLSVLSPIKNRSTHYYSQSISSAAPKNLLFDLLAGLSVNTVFKGGRTEALKFLKKLALHRDYAAVRDIPSQEGSTHLSSALKFTLISPRECFLAICKALGCHHELIRSLYWRDFFTCIAFFFPHVFQGAFHPKYDKMKWSYAKHSFQRWCEGKTGFPIVDAGMREMNATGFMHNRVRMIAASFLVKDLGIDWRWGEKYFANTLIDYDPAVNNGNWQWVASTGCDAQPYFRTFNPWSQQEKFDPDCIYIKRWIKELSDIPSDCIHRWDEAHYGLSSGYPAPMLDHTIAMKSIRESYSQLN